MVTLHDASLALNYCDRLLILSQGRASALLTPAADSPEQMEKALSVVYGSISLARCKTRSGRDPTGHAERGRPAGGQYAMRAATKITFYDDQDNKFFGEGPCRLLHGVEETGSLRAAAQAMGMAYTKALKLLRTAEQSLGFPLTRRSTGGGTAVEAV